MGAITVRKIDDDLIRDLRISAAERGVSMEQEARDRLRQRLPRAANIQEDDGDTPKWRLKATMDEILALGVKPDRPIDHKSESDALYDYLEDE